MTAEPRAASVGASAAPTSSAYHGLRPRMVTGGGRSQCGRQRQTYGKEPDVVPQIFSQVRESYAAGVCE